MQLLSFSNTSTEPTLLRTATMSQPFNATQFLLDAKAAKGLSFEAIAKEMGKDEVWVAAAFYGQAKFTPEVLKFHFLEKTASDQHWPHRGLGPMPPTGTLYEGVLVYGTPIKVTFGDGIMSMIDCKIHVEKKPDPKGDRVLLTFDGKFLPYATW
ncbi:cyanate lyase C-terminal domain-containing protein [Flagelloscypha sp. PMI_526]|nr:cyanate lyase C-terminal domain-containing protein [Flagelloscypha sp. PMI_526]